MTSELPVIAIMLPGDEGPSGQQEQKCCDHRDNVERHAPAHSHILNLVRTGPGSALADFIHEAWYSSFDSVVR